MKEYSSLLSIFAYSPVLFPAVFATVYAGVNFLYVFVPLMFILLFIYTKAIHRRKIATAKAGIGDGLLLAGLLPLLIAVPARYYLGLLEWLVLLAALILAPLICYLARILLFSASPSKEGFFLFVFLIHPAVIVYGIMFLLRLISSFQFLTASIVTLCMLFPYFMLYKLNWRDRRVYAVITLAVEVLLTLTLLIV